MDPYCPIQGISIERYAELGAELDGIEGDQAQVQKVVELGVSAEAWAAAKQGWTARMQDMSLMGQVATRYMALYKTPRSRARRGRPRSPSKSGAGCRRRSKCSGSRP